MGVEETLLMGRGNRMERAPAEPWRQAVEQSETRVRPRLAFMTDEHRLAREAAVRHLPRNDGRPLATLDLARITGLTASRVDQVVIDLHRNLFFLVRSDAGDVSWAFPVTLDRTPHRLAFDSGERLYAA